tara:strand:- start:400 stop:1350 length:951 start_codon:yes stop_codon:yes gene_type:complete
MNENHRSNIPKPDAAVANSPTSNVVVGSGMGLQATSRNWNLKRLNTIVNENQKKFINQLNTNIKFDQKEIETFITTGTEGSNGKHKRIIKLFVRLFCYALVVLSLSYGTVKTNNPVQYFSFFTNYSKIVSKVIEKILIPLFTKYEGNYINELLSVSGVYVHKTFKKIVKGEIHGIKNLAPNKTNLLNMGSTALLSSKMPFMDVKLLTQLKNSLDTISNINENQYNAMLTLSTFGSLAYGKGHTNSLNLNDLMRNTIRLGAVVLTAAIRCLAARDIQQTLILPKNSQVQTQQVTNIHPIPKNRRAPVTGVAGLYPTK